MEKITTLDTAWDKINSLGGTASDEVEKAYVEAIGDALTVLEELGAMNPARRGHETPEYERE